MQGAMAKTGLAESAEEEERKTYRKGRKEILRKEREERQRSIDSLFTPRVKSSYFSPQIKIPKR